MKRYVLVWNFDADNKWYLFSGQDDLTRDANKRDLLGNKHQTGIQNFLEKHSIVFICINTYK